MGLTLKLDDIKPLLGAVGLGQDPTPAPKDVSNIATPPMPPPPTPAQAGFSLWNADPKNQQTIANSLTMPGTPITPPNTPPASPLSSSPTPPPMANVKPLGQGPENPLAGVKPLADPNAGLSSKLGADQTELARLQKTGSGASQIKNPFLRTIARIGDAAGTILAPGVMSAVPGTTVHNWTLQNLKQGQVAGDQTNLKDALSNQDIQSQSAQRDALAAKANQQADDMTPFQLSPAQAQAINQPALAGTTATMRDYNRLLGMAGNNNTSKSNNQNTNDTKVKIAATKAEVAALKPKQRDDQYISIMSKPAAERTPDELAFKSGYEQYIKTSKTDPGVTRAVAGAMARPLQTVDPNSNNVIYQTAGNAIKSGAAAPTSMDYAAGKSLQKDFTSGPDAKNLNAFNTASAHLQTLGTMSEALHNNDIQGLNRIGNEYAQQTGSPAPTNFQAVKSAVAGEVSKTFKGGQATDAEIKEFNDAVSSANSPAQLRGVISTYQDLMDSKREALQQQYTQGMQGKPNFGTPSVSGKGAPSPTGGGTLPPQAASQLKEGQQHTFNNGQVWTLQGGKPVRVK